MGYQRSQLISSLWTVFAGPFTVSPVPLKMVPKKFVRRVTNLIDRGVGVTPERRAGQKGVFQEYENGDAVEVALGLSLQNVGIPQSDVVNFIHGFRDIIRARLKSMPRSSVGHYPNFVVIQACGVDEAFRRYRVQPQEVVGDMLFYEPVFVENAEEWQKLARKLGEKSNECIIVEWGDIVTHLYHALSVAETSNRGRA